MNKQNKEEEKRKNKQKVAINSREGLKTPRIRPIVLFTGDDTT